MKNEKPPWHVNRQKLSPGQWGFGFGLSGRGAWLEFARWIIEIDRYWDDDDDEWAPGG